MQIGYATFLCLYQSGSYPYSNIPINTRNDFISYEKTNWYGHGFIKDLIVKPVSDSYSCLHHNLFFLQSINDSSVWWIYAQLIIIIQKS